MQLILDLVVLLNKTTGEFPCSKGQLGNINITRNIHNLMLTAKT